MKIFGVELRFNGFRILSWKGISPRPPRSARQPVITHIRQSADDRFRSRKAGLVPAPPGRKARPVPSPAVTLPGRFRTRVKPTTSGNQRITFRRRGRSGAGLCCSRNSRLEDADGGQRGSGVASSHTHDVMTAKRQHRQPVNLEWFRFLWQRAQAKYLRGDGTWATPPTSSYTHPTTAGYKHVPAGGESGAGSGLLWRWHSCLDDADRFRCQEQHPAVTPMMIGITRRRKIKNLIDATFLTKTFTGAKVSIAGKTAKAITITCATPSGYAAIGVIGYLYRQHVHPALPCGKRPYGCLHNTDSNTISVTPTITMLYAKSGAV